MNTFDYIFGKNQFKMTNKQLMNEKIRHETEEEAHDSAMADLEYRDQRDESNN